MKITTNHRESSSHRRSKVVASRQPVTAAFDDDMDDFNDTLDDVADTVEDIQDTVDDEVDQDDPTIDTDNNIANHYIAECDTCHGLFISAVIESDQEVEKISGVCPICGKETDQLLRWVIHEVDADTEE